MTLAVVLLAAACAGLLIVVLGSRQPSIIQDRQPGVVDTFTRDDGSLLDELPDGRSWQLEGTWEIVAGSTFLRTPPEGAATGFAVLPDEATRQRISATVFGVSRAGGLVARYQSLDHYVSLVPLPTYGTWQVAVVRAGQVVQSANVGLVETAEGSRAELVVSGERAWVIVDGSVRGEPVDISAAPDSGKAGLIARLEDGASTRFDVIAYEGS